MESNLFSTQRSKSTDATSEKKFRCVLRVFVAHSAQHPARAADGPTLIRQWSRRMIQQRQEARIFSVDGELAILLKSFVNLEPFFHGFF